MNKKIKALLLIAVNECGRSSVSNIISSIEEQLTIDEAKNIKSFLTWAFFDWDKRSFGHGMETIAKEKSLSIYIQT